MVLWKKWDTKEIFALNNNVTWQQTLRDGQQNLSCMSAWWIGRACWSAVLGGVGTHIHSQRPGPTSPAGQDREAAAALLPGGCDPLPLPRPRLFSCHSSRILTPQEVSRGSVKVSIDKFRLLFFRKSQNEIFKSIGKGGPGIHSKKPNNSCALIGWWWKGEFILLFSFSIML